MAEQQDQVLIEVKFDTSTVTTATQNLADAMTKAAKAKEEIAKLNKTIKENGSATEQQAKEMAQWKKQLEESNRAIKSNTAIIQASTAERKDETASLDEQRQYLNMLQKAYAGLSAEQKKTMDEAMGGAGKLQEAIKNLNDSLAEQEHQIGENGRNVGNYTESITKAFGQMSQAGELLSPAISLLNSMGAEGKKVATALNALSNIMKLLGKSGMIAANAQKAQAAATNATTAATAAQTTATTAQTAAQTSLNAVMAANPIGLIIAGISTLLPLIQAFCNDTKDAEAAQKKFNEEAEAYNTILAQRGREEDFELEEMKIMGATDLELAKQRKENRKRDYNDAVAYYNKLDLLRQKAHDDGKKKLEEEYETQLAEQDKVVKQTRLAWQKAGDAVALEQLRITQDAVKKSEERTDAANKEAEQLQRGAKVATYESQQYIQNGLAKIAKQAADLNKQITDNSVQSVEQLADSVTTMVSNVGDLPTPDYNKIAQLWGLDEEGIEYLKKQVEAGVDLWDALNDALDDQTKRQLTKVGEEVSKWSSAVMGAMENFFDFANQQGEIELENFKNEQDEKKKALDDRLKKGIVSQAQYDKQVAALEAETDRREKEMSREQAKRNKAFGIMQAAIDTALSIINAFATTPFPASIAMAALAAATGAASIATIAAEPLPQFASGGVVEGTSYTGDNVQARVNSGEMILNREQQTRLFDALSSNNNTLGIDYEAMAAANAALPAPVVVYSEMQEFGQKVTTYNEIASI